MLDNYIGSFCAMMVPHVHEYEFAPWTKDEATKKRYDEEVPKLARYLQAAMEHPYYDWDIDKLLQEIGADLELRGKDINVQVTVNRRIHAWKLLLDNSGQRGIKISPSVWEASHHSHDPPSHWSPEQAEVLNVIDRGVAVDDANVQVHSRMLLVTGKPGSGKTQAVCGAAIAAANRGNRVLIACPLGALVDVYRQKLPPNENIVIETIHASHRISRKADEEYNPPGRLRTFDLIIYDEVSQLGSEVWRKVRTAIVELNPHPFVVLVGDFKQLQPARDEPELETTVRNMVEKGTLREIELQQHPYARSNDSELLDFLDEIREHQPSKRPTVEDFFGDRRLARDQSCREDAHIHSAVEDSKRIEAHTGKAFTFLTVTNSGARKLNHTRCAMDFADTEEVQHWQLHCSCGDPDYLEQVLAILGMRIRLTRNVDKERGFVNGAVCDIVHKLRKNVFIAKTPRGVHLLVHPVQYDGVEFMPYTYGYAMTIRRAQGATCELAGLWFDHTFPPDRGYGYVGASRVRIAIALFLMGKIRRTDWLPVGARDTDQVSRGNSSKSTKRGSDSGSDDHGESSDANAESGSEDQGGSSSGKELSEEDHGASDDSRSAADDDSDMEDPGATHDDVDDSDFEDPGAAGDNEGLISDAESLGAHASS